MEKQSYPLLQNPSPSQIATLYPAPFLLILFSPIWSWWWHVLLVYSLYDAREKWSPSLLYSPWLFHPTQYIYTELNHSLYLWHDGNESINATRIAVNFVKRRIPPTQLLLLLLLLCKLLSMSENQKSTFAPVSSFPPPTWNSPSTLQHHHRHYNITYLCYYAFSLPSGSHSYHNHTLFLSVTSKHLHIVRLFFALLPSSSTTGLRSLCFVTSHHTRLIPYYYRYYVYV